MFHDGNDRNLERVMQNLAENAMAFRLASCFPQGARHSPSGDS